MLRRAYWALAVTAVAVLFWSASSASAQRHGSGGGNRPGGDRGGQHGDNRGGGDRQRGQGGEWHHQGIELGLGAWPGYYRWAGHPNGYYGGPYYSWDGQYYPSYDYYGNQGPTGYRSFYPQEMEEPAPAPSNSEFPALVSVRVPADAEVWFDGDKTEQNGAYRLFTSPPLHQDQSYSYQIRAHWRENGQDMDQTRTVPVHAGDRVTVNFLTPASSKAPPAKLPMPRSELPSIPPPRD
jgi:uncharacterized protein (TIGR03000 family)